MNLEALDSLYAKSTPACEILAEQHEQDSEGDETWCAECCITERGEMQMGFPCSYLNLVALHNSYPALRDRLRALEAALSLIAHRAPIMGSTGEYRRGQLEALEGCRNIARAALDKEAKDART